MLYLPSAFAFITGRSLDFLGGPLWSIVFCLPLSKLLRARGVRIAQWCRITLLVLCASAHRLVESEKSLERFPKEVAYCSHGLHCQPHNSPYHGTKRELGSISSYLLVLRARDYIGTGTEDSTTMCPSQPCQGFPQSISHYESSGQPWRYDRSQLGIHELSPLMLWTG